jgi:hypothetical protein
MKEKASEKAVEASDNFFEFLHNKINALSTSKIFVGIMIIVLNVSSKFVTIKLSKTMELYLKYTFSKNILIFAIAYVGSRDIYVALFVTLLFIVLMDYLLNEDSVFCILPDSFKDHHSKLVENLENKSDLSNNPTQDEINRAIKTLSNYQTSGQSANVKKMENNNHSPMF